MMIRGALILMVLVFVGLEATAQYSSGPFKTKRKKVVVQNYTLYLHLHDIAVEYSTKIEFKTDSLVKATNTTYHRGLFDFRIRILQSLEHVLFRSDPVIAFLDSWVFAVQIINYLNTDEAKGYLGYGHPVMLKLFQDLAQEFPPTYNALVEEDPSNMAALVAEFSLKHPIVDHHLIRTSVIDGTAHWVGDAKLGLTGGLYTITDLLRNMSDRLNYHAEFTPKMIGWNIESTLGNLMGTDSIVPILEQSISSLAKITQTLDSIDYLVYSITDTVLTDIDRQRWETLHFLSSERKAFLEHFSSERRTLVNQLIQERVSLEKLVQKEREASLMHFQQMIKETTTYSFDRIDETINRIFIKILLLTAVIAIALVLALVAYKKL